MVTNDKMKTFIHKRLELDLVPENWGLVAEGSAPPTLGTKGLIGESRTLVGDQEF